MPDAALDGLLAQAVAAHRQGKPDEAEALYREILSVSPAHFDALHMLGVLYAQRRDYPAAIALLGQATAIKPDNAPAHCNMAKALGGCGRLADAVESYDAALRIDPDQPEAQYNRGGVLFRLRRFEQAVASYDEVLRLWPDNSRALNNRGNALRGLGRLPEALTSYDRAVQIAPDFAEAWSNRGNALQTLGRLAESLESYDRAIALSSEFAEAYCNRGITLEALGQLQEALDSYEHALRIAPDHAETYNNRGSVLLNLGQPSEALASFDRALAIKPDYADAHLNAGLCHLLIGDFAMGWREFEWRWAAALEPSRPVLDGPAWLGEELLQGKTILLWCEQGLGDSIQFCRFAKVIAARGATVLLWVHAALESLMAGLEGPERILRAGEKVPKTDYHCALLSVPLALNIDLSNIPADRQYLFADPKRVESWSRKLGPRRRPRIGFAWSANATHRNDRNRSIPFEQFVRIADGPLEFFCLQKDIREDDRAFLEQRSEIRQFCDQLQDFEDTAALIQHMDLVITVDTSIAHLAGALGRPVWILLPFNADWRWLLDRTDSPWYPTALLLRQPTSGNWRSVLDEVTRRLGTMEFAASGLETVASVGSAQATMRRNRARVAGALAQAVAAHGSGKLTDAEALYRQVLSLEPEQFDALHMLGVVQAQRLNYPEAIELFGQALAVRPDDAAAHCNLGNALRGFGRPLEAIASYGRALQIDPAHMDALYNRGHAHRALGQLEEALADYDAVLRIRPDFPEALHYRGSVLFDLKRVEEALSSYDHALRLRPDEANALNSRGIALRTLRRLPEALASYDRIVQISPELAVAHNNRGNVLLDLDQLQEALASYDRAVELAPDYAEAYGNRAVVLQAAKRIPEAMDAYERALELRPDHAPTHYNASMCRLLMGDFAPGWLEHEWRWKVHRPMAFDQPLWLGKESLRGKSIVLWDEQGFGDTIQFCRFAKLVAAQGATVLLSVVPGLRSLMAGVAGVTRVLQEGDDIGADYHCPLLSLPLAFGTHLGNIPADKQYLHADAEHVAAWHDRLTAHRLPRVGLAWSGNPAHKSDRHRSIALEEFARLAIGPFEFISLQKDLRARDQPVLEQRRDIRRFDADLADFQDTAALVQHMDLVITVDTVVAHLAAALGRPVWLLLPFVPDWRWLLDRDDSPWYPTIRLFRQPRPGDWRSVIDRVIRELPTALE